MSYSESKKLTAQEKKLASLKMQLYGKDKVSIKLQATSDKATEKTPPTPTLSQSNSYTPSDLNFLRRDLFKTAGIVSFLIAIQFIVYFLVAKGIVKL